MPGWTIRLPSILAKGFLIFADMSTLQNYSYCSQDKGLVDGKNLPSRGAQWLLQKIIFIFPSGIVINHYTKISVASTSAISLILYTAQNKN